MTIFDYRIYCCGNYFDKEFKTAYFHLTVLQAHVYS